MFSYYEHELVCMTALNEVNVRLHATYELNHGSIQVLYVVFLAVA